MQRWHFASIRIVNICVNIGLNLFFFLLCPYLVKHGYAASFIDSFYDPSFGIGYIFIAYFTSSLLTFLLLLPKVFKVKFTLIMLYGKR